MSADIESVEDFRARARAWIDGNLGPAQPWDLSQFVESDEEELAAVARDRMLQRKFFDAGFAGLCFPKEYGGQGLTPEHNRAFNEELSGREYPSRFTVPTFTPCATVLLEFGTTEQKARHLPAILKGDEFWAQLLSEPGGGSDVAGITTRATRVNDERGDGWILNGSKVWTSRAWWHDWGLILARTNWDLPKHSGMTVFILPLHQPGVEITRIERLSGETEACQEFFTDVFIPDSDRIGEIDTGWNVGTRWMYHERVGHNSPYVTKPVGMPAESGKGPPVVGIARQGGADLDDPAVLELIGEHCALEIVTHELQRRIASAAASGYGNKDLSSIDRLFRGVAKARQATIALDLAGQAASAWTEEEEGAGGSTGMNFLMRQVICIGGGTTEISRNVVAERVLGMPREPTGDKNVPFKDVQRGPKRG
jgi:alkylation response protein AidB-like acyl-CoA dehydrogenase